jgi:hypothetical protein
MVKKMPSLLLARRVAIFAILLLCLCAPLSAGDPHSAYYSPDTDKLLWFIHASDIHVGAYQSTASANLQWLVSEARDVINPSFIVVTGDLTDSTNGNAFGLPNGPYQAEWDQYKSILSNRVDADFYFDLPGNHDAYNDQYFAYYLANSVHGVANHTTQASWIREGPWGKYHFLGVNTADNTGDPFSLSPPYGDHAGLDANELSFIEGQLTTHKDASLTLIFGHHPLAPTNNSSDTYLYYGKDEFVSLMNDYGASLYGYGHIHVSSEGFFTQNMIDGVFYPSVAALGKGSPNEYTVTAIDCNGIASVTRTVGAWPVVLITAPMDRHLGSIVNPYAYSVRNGATNPIRALVFDPGPVSQVLFRVDGGAWHPMTSVSGNPRLWQATWDASALPEREHTVDVQATTGSGVWTDTVTTYVKTQGPGYFDTVQKTFIGYYQRPGDPGGLLYWAGRLSASGGNLNEIIEAFANSAESQALYGTIDSGNIPAVVNGIYNALFGRGAEAEGLNWYVNGFNSGRYTAATIMLDVLYGAQNEDLQSINNKLATANLFTRTIDPELDGLNFQVTYAGDADAIKARSFVSSVTDNPATVPTQEATTTWMKTNIADPGDPILNR